MFISVVLLLEENDRPSYLLLLFFLIFVHCSLGSLHRGVRRAMHYMLAIYVRIAKGSDEKNIFLICDHVVSHILFFFVSLSLSHSYVCFSACKRGYAC